MSTVRRPELPQTFAALRGELPAAGPGARGLERFARNPECLRLRALTLAGVSPADVARAVYGDGEHEGQSPFAIRRGDRFEARLFDNGAERLVAEYRKHGALPERALRVVDVGAHARGGKEAARRARAELTRTLLAERLAGAPDAADLILHPWLEVEVFGTHYEIEPDYLVARCDGPFYRVGEIKSYVDRGGKTSGGKLRGACRQAAVGVVALRHVLARLDPSLDVDVQVAAICDLVLARPASMMPSLRPLTIEGEVLSLTTALEQAPDMASELTAMLGDIEDPALDRREVLEALPNNYRSACREHCALAGACKREAVACADPVLLGDHVREALAPVADLRRVRALLDDAVEPANDDEAMLAQRLRRAMDAHGRVVNHGG